MYTVPYGFHQFESRDNFTVTHSIDMLMLSYPLYNHSGELPSYSHPGLTEPQLYANDVANLFLQHCPTWSKENNFADLSKNPKNMFPYHIWSPSDSRYGGVFVECGFRRQHEVFTSSASPSSLPSNLPDSDIDDSSRHILDNICIVPMIHVRFNPNKHMNNEFLLHLLQFIWSNSPAQSGSLLKFDYAIDIPLPPDRIVISSQRKCTHTEVHTRYYGPRGIGQLKVYDKAFELNSKSKSVAPLEPLTRCEWTLSLDINFPSDRINIKPDFTDLPKYPGLDPATYKLLQVAISYGATPKELADCYSVNHRKKIKDACSPPTNAFNPSSLFCLTLLLQQYSAFYRFSLDTRCASPLLGAAPTVLAAS